MFAIGPLGFAAPWLLLGLIALPVLWLILRAVPPAPIKRHFPGIVLLLGLQDEDHESDKTPWWLLLIRCLAVASAIVAFAGPVLNPREEAANGSSLVILLDNTWANAPNWSAIEDRLDVALNEAKRDGLPVTLITLADPLVPAVEFLSAEIWQTRLVGFEPRAWDVPEENLKALAALLDQVEAFNTL